MRPALLLLLSAASVPAAALETTMQPELHRARWLAEGSYGIMVHYLIAPPGDTDEEKHEEFCKTIEDFDLDGFMRQYEATGADWLIFTIGQNTGYWCSPNTFIDRACPGHTSERDLIMEIARRVHDLGKRFIAYLPSEVSWQEPDIQEAFGWDPTDQTVFQGRYAEFVRAYALKLGGLLDGWWFDGCYDWDVFPNSTYDWALWFDAARAGNPNAIVCFNDGAFCIAKVQPVTELEDYHAGEVHDLVDGKIKLGREDGAPLYLPDSQYIAGVQWHALVPVDSAFDGGAPRRYDDDELFAFVDACRSVGGAVTLNLPISIDGTIPEDSLQQMRRLGHHLGAL